MRPLAALVFAALLAACASTPDSVDSPAASAAHGLDRRRATAAPSARPHSRRRRRGVDSDWSFQSARLPPGWHGLHLHDRGDCSDFAAGFQASGGHLGMNRRIQHGLLNRRGPEAGDLPNIFAPPRRRVRRRSVRRPTSRWHSASRHRQPALPLLDERWRGAADPRRRRRSEQPAHRQRRRPHRLRGAHATALKRRSAIATSSTPAHGHRRAEEDLRRDAVVQHERRERERDHRRHQQIRRRARDFVFLHQLKHETRWRQSRRRVAPKAMRHPHDPMRVDDRFDLSAFQT